MAIAEYIQRVDAFRDLRTEEIEALFHGSTLRQCPVGTLFFTPEDPAERLFVLKSGQVDLYRLTSSGKRLVLRRIKPGTVFGEMGLLGQTMQGCFAEASESSLVCIATRDDLRRLLQQRPDVAMRLLEALGGRLKLLEERLEQAVFSPVKVRLANFLLANMDPTTGVVAGFTHAEIGDTIGALRQTVTQTLNDMARQGLLELGHKSIRAVNPKTLEEMAAEETA